MRDPMNGINNGRSFVDIEGCDVNDFNIKEDENG
jgi:hypothetical protein